MAESLPRDELLERLTIAVDRSADPSRDRLCWLAIGSAFHWCRWARGCAGGPT